MVIHLTGESRELGIEESLLCRKSVLPCNQRNTHSNSPSLLHFDPAALYYCEHFIRNIEIKIVD